MKFSKGKKERPQKGVIYGPEGVGKTTLANDMPSPLFIDAEQGSDHLDLDRVEVDTMGDIREVVKFLKSDAHEYKTVVLDTIDWIEKRLIKELCAEFKAESIEQIEGGYGKGYTILEERMMGFLGELDSVRKKGMHIILLAHSKVQKYEDPELASSYDRYQLKLEKKTSALIKEWCDCLLFYNYDTKITDQAGTIDKKRGVQGKDRTIRTERCAAFDAKNRHHLPPVIKVDLAHPAKGLLGVFDVPTPVTASVNVEQTAPVAPATKAYAQTDLGEGAISSIIARAGGAELVAEFVKSKGGSFPLDSDWARRVLDKPERFINAVAEFNADKLPL